MFGLVAYDISGGVRESFQCLLTWLLVTAREKDRMRKKTGRSREVLFSLLG